MSSNEVINDSYYLFVEVVAQRYQQLMRGAKPKIDLRAHKFTTLARQEVVEDLVPWEYVTDDQISAEIKEAEEVEVAAAEAEAASGAAAAAGPGTDGGGKAG